MIDLSIMKNLNINMIYNLEKYIEIIRKYNTYPEVKSEEGQWQDGVIRINNKNIRYYYRISK